MKNMQRVIIVGGGFAGLELVKGLANSKKYEVILVEVNNYNFFPPLIYQVSTGFMEPSAISYPFRRILRKKENVRFRLGSLERVVPEENKIILSNGELIYDILVMATGAESNFFGNKNIERYSLPMKTISDALSLRNTILARLDRATRLPNLEDRRRLLSFVIAGAGPTGVELSGIMAEMSSFILKKDYPELKSPVRSLSNVKYDPKVGYLKMGKAVKKRTLSVNTVKSFAQTLKVMHLSKDMVQEDTFATKREAYYVSKNWDECKFREQAESDSVMDDIEALFSVRSISREQLRFVPDEHGGAVAGRLVVLDPDRDTGVVERIDCTRFGSGAYSIPASVEHLQFTSDASFVMAIETAGMFQRLVKHSYWR